LLRTVGTGEIVTGSVHEDEARFYAVRILPAVPAVRVFLVSISGDADLFLSFRGPHPSATNATWVMDDVGIEELVLRRSSEDFCTVRRAERPAPRACGRGVERRVHAPMRTTHRCAPPDLYCALAWRRVRARRRAV
jgi:hypothetical protein